MNNTRRRFMKAGSVFCLTTAASLTTTNAATALFAAGDRYDIASHLFYSRNPFEAVGHLTRQKFQQQLETDFRVRLNDSKTASLRLIEVADIESSRHTAAARVPAQECYSLMFVSNRKDAFEQGTYVIEHKALGRFALLLVNVGPAEKGFYQAIINRFRK